MPTGPTDGSRPYDRHDRQPGFRSLRWCWGHNVDGGIADATSEISHRAHADVRRAISWARELDTGVVLVPFFMRAELVNDVDDERAVAAFRALCPEAAEHGVSLCFEGSLPAERIASIAARVGSDAFGCYFDLANPLAHKGLDSPTEIRALGGLIERVHVKDTRARTDDCRPGTGRVDFAECAVALFEIGYDGWLTLETPPAPPPLVSRDLSFPRARCSPGSTGTLAASRRVLDRVRRGRWSTSRTRSIDSVSTPSSSWGRSWTSVSRTRGGPSRHERSRRSGVSPFPGSVVIGTWCRRIRWSDARTSSTFDDAWRSLLRSALRRRNGDRDHGRKRRVDRHAEELRARRRGGCSTMRSRPFSPWPRSAV